jgi:hypothetical protein
VAHRYISSPPEFPATAGEDASRAFPSATPGDGENSAMESRTPPDVAESIARRNPQGRTVSPVCPHVARALSAFPANWQTARLWPIIRIFRMPADGL